MLIKFKKAQSIAEYVLLIGIVIAAIIGMQNEIRRSLQARYHDALGYLAKETSSLGNTPQWEPSSGTKITTDQRSTRQLNEYYEGEEGRENAWMEITENASANYSVSKTE